MLSFHIASYSDQSGNYPTSSALVQKMLDVTASQLNEALTGLTGTIDLNIIVNPSLTSTAYATGAYPGYTPGGDRATLTSIAATKALTGVDGNGATADATISLSPAYMGMLASWDQTSTSGTMADELMLHETLHALGMSGFRNKATGDLPSGYQSLFDTFVTIQNGKPYFTGTDAAAILGQNVPLAPLGTTSSIYHTDSSSMSDLSQALMAPSFTNGAHELDVELAMFKDMGFSVTKTLTSLDGHTFIPGLNASVTGTAGLDRAIYSGNKADYTISSSSTGAITVSNKAGATDVDTLTGVERIQFGDVTMAFDGSGDAGKVYHLYQAAFNRAPDLSGLGFWIKSVDNGGTLQNVAHNFITSSEFTTLYGANTTNADFLTHVYTNVLHRAPDQVGYNWWLNALNSGASREGVLTGFADSVENRAQVIVDANGHEAQAYRLYQAAFNRTPDLDGLTFWINALDNGVTLNHVASEFINSNEFTTLYGANTTNADFLTHVYQNVLHRAPDQIGYNWWLDALNSGASRDGVLGGFSESVENRTQVELTGVIKDGFAYQPYVA